MHRKSTVILGLFGSLLLVSNLWKLPLPIGAIRLLVILSLAGGIISTAFEAKSWGARLMTVCFSAMPVLWISAHYFREWHSSVIVIIVALSCATAGRLLGQVLGAFCFGK